MMDDKDSLKDSLRDSIHRDVHERIRERVSSLRSRNDRRPPNVQSGIIWGAAICVVGVILLLDHLGVIAAGNLWRFWPSLVIVGGVSSLIQPGQRAWGVCVVAAGALFQLSSLGLIRFHWADLWPIAIIVAGVMMIWGSITTRRFRAQVGSPEGGDGPSLMNVTAVFGGIERHITAADFRGGTVTAIFGGGELDFHDAGMEQDEVVLEVNAVFGGFEIRVPENWQVEMRGQTMFGGFSDSTRGSATADVNALKRKVLILTGTALFGGVEIKN